MNALQSNRLINTLFQSQALRQSVTVSFGNVITAVFMALAMIIAARSLGPHQFGLFSVATAVMLIFSKVTDLGTHQLVPRLYHRWANQPELRQHFMAWMVSFKTVTSLGFAVVAFFLVPAVQKLLAVSDGWLIVWAFFGAIVLGWYELVHLALSAGHRFSAVSLMTVAQALVKLLGFALLGFLELQFMQIAGLRDSLLRLFVVLYALAPLVSIGWLREISQWWRSEKISSRMKSTFRSTLKRFWGHALIGTVTMILIQNIDILLINQHLSSYETGIYAGALRISTLISLFTYSISSVLNNRITRYNTPDLIKSYLQKSLWLAVAAALGFFAFVPFAQPLLVVTIGPEYLSGLLPFIILVANACLGLSLVPFSSFFFRLDVPCANSLGGVIQLITMVAILSLSIDQLGILGAALARVGATAVFAVLVLMLVSRSWSRNFADASEKIE